MGFVHPQLEYGSKTWDPGLAVENNGAYKVEMVQQCAAKWKFKRYHNTFSLTDMLEDLGWRTLELTRGLHSFSRSTTDSYQSTPESTSDIQLEDPGTFTARASFLYLPAPPLIVSHSTQEQSLSETVILSLSLRILI